MMRRPVPSITNSSPPPIFAFMIPTASRPNQEFYLDKVVYSLKAAGIPPTSVLIFNTEDESKHEKLKQFRNKIQGCYTCSSADTYHPVHFTVRPKDSPFAPKPQWTPPRLPLSDRFAMAAKDKPEQRYWRTKEAADFMFLSYRALKLFRGTDWFVFLQDDAVCRAGGKLERRLLHVLNNKTVRSRGCGYLNSYGNVALIFNRVFLQSFLGYLELRYHLIPVDWLLQEFLKSNGDLMPTWPGEISLFMHIGAASSSGADRTDLIGG